jgi:hypothetical protein
MAQQAIVPASKNCRNPAPVLADDAVPECVDTSMQATQPTRFNSAMDRSNAQACIEKLAPGEHAVLAACEAGKPLFAEDDSPPATCRFLCTHRDL